MGIRIGTELTLQVCVEPLGLGGPDVARPPPRVGVARHPLQHLDMNRSELRRSSIDRIGFGSPSSSSFPDTRADAADIG